MTVELVVDGRGAPEGKRDCSHRNGPSARPRMDVGRWTREDGVSIPAQPTAAPPQATAAAGMDLSPSLWDPKPRAFQRYASRLQSRLQGRSPFRRGICISFGHMRLEGGSHLVIRLTRDILLTFRQCNSSFTYSEEFNPKRYLTNPSVGTSNNGLDNSNSELILAVNGALINGDACRYIVKDMLGQGTFGQVAKCWSDELNRYVAVKVIKNQPAYYHQARVEIGILHMLNHKFDPGDRHHIVRILDHFVFQGHLCLVFELLTVNLFELIKHNQFRGISLNLLRTFTRQILDALMVLRDASVIHCDLKPENILLTKSLNEVKLIDFGSACMENRTVYSYIQSRFYRSPEVLLGHPYTAAIDMWSLGCVVAELFLGLPLFPGASEYDLLQRMIETLGTQPPDYVLRNAKNTGKFFKHASFTDRTSNDSSGPFYHFLSESEYEAREKKKPTAGKRYFRHVLLEDIIVEYPLRVEMTPEEIDRETQMRFAFVDFLRGLVQFDPRKRWTPRQAAQHPFLTQEQYQGPYEPLPETPRTPVGRGMAVDHNPVAGHWFGTGLSPQVVPLNAGQHFMSPHYQAPPVSLASSFGSVGSYGSYDQPGLGSSFGSYTDTSGIFPNYPTPPVTGMNGTSPGASGSTVLGMSPETWRRTHGHCSGLSVLGHTQLGMSPTSGNGFRPMPLGASPSQFTPPTSQLGSPASPSHMSPGRHGPTSPARSTTGTGVLSKGKSAAGKQFQNKRRGYVAPASNSNTGHENYWPRQQGNGSGPSEVGPCSSVDGTARSGSYPLPRGSAVHPLPRRHNRGAIGLLSNASPLYHPQSYAPGTLGSLLASPDRGSEGGEDMSPPPDPGDWEPDYSDELLLNDTPEGFSNASGSNLTGVMGSGGARLGPGPGFFSGPGPGSGGAEYQPPLLGFLGNGDYVGGTIGQHAQAQACSVRSSDGTLGPQFIMNGHLYPHPQSGVTTNVARSSALHQGSQINAESMQPPLQHSLQQGFARNMPKQQSSPSRLGPGPLANHAVQQSQRPQHNQFMPQIPVSPDNQQPAGEGGRSVGKVAQTSLKESWGCTQSPSQGRAGGSSLPGGPGNRPGTCPQGNMIVSGSSFPVVTGFQDTYPLHTQDQPSSSPPWGKNGPHSTWPLPPAPGRNYRRPG